MLQKASVFGTHAAPCAGAPNARPHGCRLVMPRLRPLEQTPVPFALHHPCYAVRALVQRVSEASVTVDGRVTGRVGAGLLVLLGVTHADTDAEARWLAEKVAALRIFPDDDGKMNRSLLDRLARGDDAGALVVSQFTLYGATAKGTRPSFVDAARPEHAEALYERFVTLLAERLGRPVPTGVFGAMMDVALVNDGPVTLLLERESRPSTP